MLAEPTSGSVKTGKAQAEQMFSALPPIGGIARWVRRGSFSASGADISQQMQGRRPGPQAPPGQ